MSMLDTYRNNMARKRDEIAGSSLFQAGKSIHAA